MASQKESTIYLGFFKENLWLILVPALALSLSFYFYQKNQPGRRHHSALLEMEYNQEDVLKKIVLADEAVTLLRTSQVQKELGISPVVSVGVVKNGPLAINVDVSTHLRINLSTDLEKLTTFSKQRFPVKEVGVITERIEKVSEYLLALIGFTVGLLFGLIISLIRTYFKYF